MGTVSVSFRIDEDAKARLKREAELEERSESYIANQAIKQYLDRQQRRRHMLDQALVEADKGTFISSEVMHEWVDSWGSDKETPLPEPDVQIKE